MLTHIGAFVVGAAAAIVVLASAVLRLAADPTAHEHSTVASPPATSPAARTIAARLAPGLQKVAREHEGDFVRNAGGPVKRAGVRVAYPIVVREIPVATEVAADHLLSHFGAMSVGEIARMLVDHAQAKGEPVHPSLKNDGSCSQTPILRP